MLRPIIKTESTQSVIPAKAEIHLHRDSPNFLTGRGAFLSGLARRARISRRLCAPLRV